LASELDVSAETFGIPIGETYFREKGTVAVGVFGDAEVDGAGVAWRGQ